MLDTLYTCLHSSLEDSSHEHSYLEDSEGKKLALDIKKSLGLETDKIILNKALQFEGVAKNDLEKALEGALFHDPILQDASFSPYKLGADWVVEVAYRQGVTDNNGRTARELLELFLDKEAQFFVSSKILYHIFGNLEERDIQHIAENFIANDLIERIRIKKGEDWDKNPGFEAVSAQVKAKATNEVNYVAILTMTDEELIALSQDNVLALSLEEMQIIKAFYACPDTKKERKAKGLEENPTDAELEALAQTWSEHCKHKIFAALIDYENKETGHREKINSVYKTNIQGSTQKLRKRMGDDDFCRSVFKDNAGVVAFNETHDVCIKAETHNSPSALDPYGGAMTGVVGVNRDVMGTGIGGELLCNTDVLCVASPFYDEELPPRLMHPRRILEGARKGVEEGGNKSGVPTVNGSLVFDERFLGKPLVYCGTVGLIPREVAGKAGYKKKAEIGDFAVMVGGRIGRDGIHGATFSSEELHEDSIATAVQVGDPITQKKAYDFIIKARDKGLYNSITDNGAGGLSSSVGEMAEDTNGCIMDLSQAPVKYEGLKPWEILISEAQERMTLAVPPKHIEEFKALAKNMGVEASIVGEYTDSGYLDVRFGDKQVAYLPMDFLHDGLPQMKLKAVWKRPKGYERNPSTSQAISDLNLEDSLLKMLGRLNICSKESMIRQFDQDARGGSVVKPMVGIKEDGPSDAAVLRPLLDFDTGIVLSHGICPKFSDADTYWMMANAIDEAVRNAVAVGADPKLLAGVDNFCWCDPVQSERTPDGEYKLAQLVRANKALEHFCLGFGVPCVSGKDSMKNDYTSGDMKISIPPTVLFSILGRIHDVNKAVSSDFKTAGDSIYILGRTKREMGGSEFFSEYGLVGGAIPEVDLLSARQRYELLHEAMQRGFISSCHDLSDGGLAVALAEMALGGRLGATINLDSLPAQKGLEPYELLYSESASRLLVTVAPDNEEEFCRLFVEDMGVMAARIGIVNNAPHLSINSKGNQLMRLKADALAEAFKGTLS